jgi:hypothetical protein
MSAARVAPVRYDLEADMLPPLAEAVDALVVGLPNGFDRVVLFEVPAFESIPDMVIAQLDHGVLERRREAAVASVPDLTCVRALIGLTAGVVGLDALARRSGVSRAHLRRSVLPKLVEAGWVSDLGAPQLRIEFEPVLNWVVTLEAKRSKWREAYTQARRHQRVADRAFVALDAACANPARSWSAEFAAQGLGLVTVDAQTHTATVERRPRRGPKLNVDARHLLGERVVEMTHDGATVGKTFPVFGKVLPMRVCAG